MTFEEIYTGGIPESLEEKSAVLRQVSMIERRGTVISALSLTDALMSNFAGDAKKWLAWARETAQLENAEIYHRLAIGKMLLAVRGRAVIYKKLITLGGDKLLPMTRLVKYSPADDKSRLLESFLSQTEAVWNMTREEIRDAVADYLRRVAGIAIPEKDQPALPGFDDLLKQYVDCPEEKIIEAIRDETAAVSALQLGGRLITGFLEFQKRPETPKDTLLLLALKKDYEETLKQINNLLGETEDEKPGGIAANPGALDFGAAFLGRPAAPDGCGNNTVQTDSDNLAGSAPGDRADAQTECGYNTDQTGSVNPAGGNPEDGCGTAAVSGIGRAGQADGHGWNDGPGSVSGGGRAAPGMVPDPVPFRAQGRQPAGLEQLAELDEKTEAGGKPSRAAQSDPGGKDRGAGGRIPSRMERSAAEVS